MAEPEQPMETEQPNEQPVEGEQPDAAETGGSLLKQVAEALVFASPKPIATKEIVAALKAAAEGSEDEAVKTLGKVKPAAVAAALTEVAADLAATGRAFQLVEKISGWVLVSDPACATWVRQLYPEAKPTRLTGPQLETLAIIAYRQPVTRADIEAVRGVSVDGVMQVLLDRSLVKIAGRAEVPGRPLLYSTTDYFLEHFGLKTTDELPNASELKRVALPTAPVAEAAPISTQSEGAAESPKDPSTPSDALAETPADFSTPSEAVADAPADASTSSEAVSEAPEDPSTPSEAISETPEDLSTPSDDVAETSEDVSTSSDAVPETPEDPSNTSGENSETPADPHA
jgi:segregation and condensation protein B